MSHAASLAAVVLLVASIGLDIIALVTPWWDLKLSATDEFEDTELNVKHEVNVKISLWSLDVEGSSSVWAISAQGSSGSFSWDEHCNKAKLESQEKDWCMKMKPMRALVLLAACFSLFGALGVAIGNYTGNTLVDALSGFIGNVGNVCGVLAIVVSITLSIDDLILKDAKADKQLGSLIQVEHDKGPGRDGATPGYALIIAACVAQFLGGVFACIGTCQEIREVAQLAAQVKLKHDLEQGPPKSRAERAHIEHDKEDALAAERYANLKKRQMAGDPYTISSDGMKNDSAGGGSEERPKRRLIMLEKVLFRQPDSEDDECPQSMLVNAFAEIDGDGSGSIEMDELIEALSDCNIAVSKNAADTIMKEIDKNASGDVDLREFIQFFRRIEDLKRFDKKNQQRQQFATFLANFCFLADVVVVGVMLMMFINMDETEDEEQYSIIKNLLIACIVLLAFLFILVILGPILRLSLGPSAGRLQQQYELAKEIRQRKKKEMQDDAGDADEGPRRVAYSADDPPPPVNAAMFGRSYRPGVVSQSAWAPPMVQIQAPQTPQAQSEATAPLAIQDSHPQPQTQGGGHSYGGGHSHARKGHNWKYNPEYYAHAREFGEVVAQDRKGPMSWSPMQIRQPGAENSMNAPQVNPALTMTSLPGSMAR